MNQGVSVIIYPVKDQDVGGGKLTAIARDADGNLLGLIQEP